MDTRTSTREAAAVPHQVLSAVSHELRGPLGVARGYLRMLSQAGGLDARATKMVTNAQRATDQMSALLDQVSELARWVRGEHALTRVSTGLRDAVAAATAAPSPAGLNVRVELTGRSDITADVDAAQLTRAVSALVGATARSMVQGGTVVIDVRGATPGNAVLRIGPQQLLDAAAEVRPPVFERAGAGLSIFLADLIVMRHGGTLLERWAGTDWAGYECRL
jgi:signal transduction histidine kinase